MMFLCRVVPPAAVVAAAVGWLAVFAAPHRPALAETPELSWSSEGYFRTRSVLLTNLAAQDTYELIYPPNDNERVVVPEIRETSYVISRLRLMPSVRVGQRAALHLQIDAIDDVLWGDNNGLASAPLFSLNTTNQGFLGGAEQDTVQIPRIWLQFQLPVGLMQVGRVPSHWGLGLLANGGGTANVDPGAPSAPGAPRRQTQDDFFDDDFGDNHFGTTADRVLFITKPITIAKTLAGIGDTASNFLLGYAFDKVSEAPWLLAENFERRFRPPGQQGFISRGGDDINEHVFIALYSNPDWNRVRPTDRLNVGSYVILRTADEGSTQPSTRDPAEDTGSFVWVYDLWYQIRYGGWYSELEFVHIGGSSYGGVPFPAPNLKKKADIDGGVLRAGYLTDRVDGILEVGHAGGDANLADETITQRPLNPDYNVGLILFEEILREHTARKFVVPFSSLQNPGGARGFMSSGGVINANYIHPKVRVRPGLAGLQVIGAALVAWVDTPSRLLFRSPSRYLGTELDLAVKGTFASHMTFSLETGWLLFGDVLKAEYPNAWSSFSLQTRLAFLW